MLARAGPLAGGGADQHVGVSDQLAGAFPIFGPARYDRDQADAGILRPIPPGLVEGVPDLADLLTVFRGVSLAIYHHKAGALLEGEHHVAVQPYLAVAVLILVGQDIDGALFLPRRGSHRTGVHAAILMGDQQREMAVLDHIPDMP